MYLIYVIIGESIFLFIAFIYLVTTNLQLGRRIDEIDLKNFEKELEVTGWPMQLKSLRKWGDIDEEIIPLINVLNRFGIKTTDSCSGHGKKDGYVFISSKSYNIEKDDSGKQYFLLKIKKNKIRDIGKMIGKIVGG